MTTTSSPTELAHATLAAVENGLIVERWDVIQEIPAQMAHDNGMF